MTSAHDDERNLGWLEALHEAVITDQDAAFSRLQAEASQIPNVDAFRDCLRQLEQARRAGNRQEALTPGDAEPLETSAPRVIGKFEILRALGGGGQGLVFLAYDTHLRRQVALKVPKPEALVSPDARRRFLREAHAAAGLAHPAIVTVHEIGELFPACYLVSDYCPGGSLQEYLQRVSEKVAPRAAAEIVAELAAGVHYAHLHGVLHRDIKPSNIFLVERHEKIRRGTEDDPLLKFVPKLGDFGLAQLAESNGELTASGAMLGTPAYMAPEQAGGRMKEVCAATDVYGLGTVLYELLAGRPVFRGVTDADTLRQVLFVEPESPRRLNAHVPRDLEAVCLRALDKDPRRRYSSAAAFADDLHRFLEGRPTLVRPLTPVGKLWRAACRRPAVATLAALLLVSVLVASASFVTSAIEQSRLNAQLVEERNTAQKHAREALDLAYAADMRLADQDWSKNDITGLQATLARYVPQPGRYDPRGVEWHYLQTQLEASSQTLASDNGPGGCVQFSPDGKWLAAGSHDGRIRIWEMPGAKLKWTIAERPLVEINAFAFSADGKTLAAASNASRILLCDLSTGKVVRALKGGHTEWVSDVDFSPDGEQLCSVAGDGFVAIWDWKNGKRLQRFKAHTEELRSVRYTPDGQHVVTGGQEGIVQFWNLKTERSVAELVGDRLNAIDPPIWPRDIAVSADRRRMAVCWDAGGLSIYDVKNASRPILLETIVKEACSQVHFLADNRLAVSSTFGTGRIWTMGAQHPDRELRGHLDKINSISGASDGGQVATASKDGSVRLWPVETAASGSDLVQIAGRCNRMELSPRANEMALQLADLRRIAIVQIPTGEVLSELDQIPGGARSVDYSSDGSLLAVAGENSIHFYERPSGKLLWQWVRPARSGPVDALDYLLFTDSLLLVKTNHEILAIDPKTKSLAWQRTFANGLWGMHEHKPSQLLYLGDQIGTIYELQIADGRTVRVLRGPDSPINHLAVSPDGLLAVFWGRATATI